MGSKSPQRFGFTNRFMVVVTLSTLILIIGLCCAVESKESCIENVREIQDVHLGRDFGDIGFNFIIGNDGNVYEGVGWDTRGAHTGGYNSKAFGISVNGNFKYEVPNKNQINALNLLLEQGIELGKLKFDYKIYGGCQFKPTDSPGEAFYQMMQTWEHWSDEI